MHIADSSVVKPSEEMRASRRLSSGLVWSRSSAVVHAVGLDLAAQPRHGEDRRDVVIERRDRHAVAAVVDAEVGHEVGEVRAGVEGRAQRREILLPHVEDVGLAAAREEALI
jgi:hypothetical protein